jgi:hypothetical protein
VFGNDERNASMTRECVLYVETRPKLNAAMTRDSRGALQTRMAREPIECVLYIETRPKLNPLN